MCGSPPGSPLPACSAEFLSSCQSFSWGPEEVGTRVGPQLRESLASTSLLAMSLPGRAAQCGLMSLLQGLELCRVVAVHVENLLSAREKRLTLPPSEITLL